MCVCVWECLCECEFACICPCVSVRARARVCVCVSVCVCVCECVCVEVYSMDARSHFAEAMSCCAFAQVPCREVRRQYARFLRLPAVALKSTDVDARARRDRLYFTDIRGYSPISEVKPRPVSAPLIPSLILLLPYCHPFRRVGSWLPVMIGKTSSGVHYIFTNLICVQLK
jgi:hypothetical protein